MASSFHILLSVFIVLSAGQQCLGQTYNCTAAGRFTATACNQYYYCVASGTSYTAYLYTCPGSSKFDATTLLCTTGTVDCNRTLSTTDCTSSGFACVNSTTFELCVDGAVSGTATSCATGTYCSTSCDYECATTTSCAALSTGVFACSSAGRIGVSGNCTSYYLCVANSTSYTGYAGYLYNCPGSSKFNTATSLCTAGTATCA